MIDWQRRARALTQQLAHAEVLDESWCDAFQNTPRHVFVPRFYRHDMTVLDRSDPHCHEEWLGAVYSDESLTTHHARVPGTDLMWPTSSSTKPSLMARMLHLLDVHTGDRVLEVGTGTGYNTALLCHRLGDRNVASIDIDPDLVATARARLAELGHHPSWSAVTARRASPAPLRSIGSSPPARYPPSRAAGSFNSARAASSSPTCEENSSATSQSCAKPVRQLSRAASCAAPDTSCGCAPHADNPLRDGNAFAATIDHDHATQHSTELDPAALDHPHLQFLLQLRDPTIQAIWRTRRGSTELLFIHSRDGAWAEVDTTERHGRHTVIHGGPRPIWDQIEDTAVHWSRLGRPRADRFGLTATAEQHRWLDTPGSPAFD